MQPNPYDSPRECQPEPSRGRIVLNEFRSSIAGAGMFLGASMGVMGHIITFIPTTGPNWWYVYAAVVASGGLLWPGWWGRGFAVVLLIWLGAEINASYWRGKAYGEWLRTHPTPDARANNDN